MDYEFIMTIIFLIVLMTIQLTLNKILRELKDIRVKMDRIENKNQKYDD